MRFVPTRLHGAVDYLAAVLLIAGPWLLGVAGGDAAQWVPVALGVLTILYSLVTDYEWGALRRLPMPAHLVLDALNGAVLAVSPWLFGFAGLVWVPYLLFGLFEVLMSLITRTAPEAVTVAAHRTA